VSWDTIRITSRNFEKKGLCEEMYSQILSQRGIDRGIKLKKTTTAVRTSQIAVNTQRARLVHKLLLGLFYPPTDLLPDILCCLTPLNFLAPHTLITHTHLLPGQGSDANECLERASYTAVGERGGDYVSHPMVRDDVRARHVRSGANSE